MEALGQVVDQIRRNRNITIETLCEGIISPSTYSRFVSDKTSLASDSFIKIISRLHMTFAMFLQDYQTFFKLKHDYAILSHAKTSQKIDIILDLVVDYQVQQGQKRWRTHDERFLTVAQLLVNLMIEDDNNEEKLNEAKTLLASLKSFTDNDFFAVKLLLPYLSFTDAEAIISKPLKKMKELKDSSLVENLYFVAGLMYIKALKAGDYKNTRLYYKMIDEIYLDQMDLGWKITHKMYSSIGLFFSGETAQAVQNLEQVIMFYMDLNLFHQASNVFQLTQELGIRLGQVKVNV